MAEAPFFSGAERALLILARHLDRTRFRVCAAVGSDGELAASLRAIGVETWLCPIVRTSFRSPITWSRSVLSMCRAIRRANPTVIHVNDAPSFQPAGYAARIMGVPTLVHVRFPDSKEGFEWMLKPGFQRSVFVSEALRSDAVANAPDLFDHSSDVVYDGVELPEILNASTRATLRRELGLPPNKAIVAITGQVAEVKGIWEFVDAARLMVSDGLEVSFAVLGDDLQTKGVVRRQMQERVHELGLAERFHFLGFRKDAPRLVQAFDVIAVPSHVEPLGYATLEGMAAARPVVGSRVGGIPEMIVDGKTGLLSPTRDATKLSAALASLVVDARRAQTFGAAGRERVREVFSTERHATRMASLYESMVFGRPATS